MSDNIISLPACAVQPQASQNLTEYTLSCVSVICLTFPVLLLQSQIALNPGVLPCTLWGITKNLCKLTDLDLKNIEGRE